MASAGSERDSSGDAPISEERTGKGRYLGNSLLVSKEGEALTNAHVVENCQQISVAGRDALLSLPTAKTILPCWRLG